MHEIIKDIPQSFIIAFFTLVAFVIFVVIFRNEIKELFDKLTGIKIKSRKRQFEFNFRKKLKRAKERARGVEKIMTASGTMPETRKVMEFGKQAARDIVLEAWGALKQTVYNSCAAIDIPLTPATEIQVAVQRLANAKAIHSDTAFLIELLHELGQDLVDDKNLRPLADDARGYTQLANVLVDWMALSIISPGKGSAPNKRKETSVRRTVIGKYFPQPRPDSPAAMLVGIGGKVQGQRFSIDKEHYRIGSNFDNDLCLDEDEFVSGTHACLEYEKGSLLLSDMDSTNGTFLNDQPVKGTAFTIQEGDNIRLGHSVFNVERETDSARNSTEESVRSKLTPIL